MDAGVVGRVDIVAVNLKMDVVVAGGVRGSMGWRGRGDGGRAGMENIVVAMCRMLARKDILVGSY